MQELSPQEVEQIWQEVCNQLQSKLSPAVYNTWIVSNPLTKIEYIAEDKAVATITSPTAFHSTNLKKNLHEQLKSTLDFIIGRASDVNYTVGSPFTTTATVSPTSNKTFHSVQSTMHVHDSLESAPSATNFISFTHTKKPNSPRVEDLFSESTMQSAAADRVSAISRKVGLRLDYTFETFAVSTSNEMAHAAATAVSNRPGESYNPLFLYGGVGVGKTHLMHAIGNNILQNNTEARIIYSTGEEFTNEIVDAIRTKRAAAFKQKYRSADVLFIDDIQFIAGKNAVQEEFFHTFNSLTKQLSQIVLTSDRPPHEISLLEDRLRSRFEAGLMIDIQQPSFELRTAIFLVKAKAVHLNVPIDIAKLIASKVESARKIEGIITSLRSEVELKKKLITPELVESILKIEVESKRPKIRATASDIIRAVANHFHLKQSALKGQSRVKNLVNARHIAMYLLKEELSLPLVEIGKWFSGRDHTSVLHAVKKIENDLQFEDMLQQDVSAIRMTLAASS